MLVELELGLTFFVVTDMYNCCLYYIDSCMSKRSMLCVATQDRVFPYYVPNSSIKHSKSDSKDRSQEIL
jgi:hypothetical protein